MLARRIKIGLVLLGVIMCITITSPLSVRSQNQQAKDYNRFMHQTHSGAVKIPGTSQMLELKCDYCHLPAGTKPPARVATTERNRQLQLKFPGHRACIECHVTQFTARPPQTCAICHRTEDRLTASPPQRDFPLRQDFNAFFDAKQHEAHINYALPDGQKAGCNFCHKLTAKKVAMTIASHPECYVCHTTASHDQKASLKSGCAVCHTQMISNLQPFSTKYWSRAYGAQFSHQTHIGYADGNCLACHTISGGYNQPAPRTIKVQQHLSEAARSGRGCFSCHDGVKQYRGRPIFSGEDFQACDKCHTRPDKKVLVTAG
jgi:hypothetical protein